MARLNIFQQVRELDGWKASAFALTLVERMFPNYQLFCQTTDFADEKAIRNSLDILWEFIAFPKTKINITAQLEKLEESTPDIAQFDNYGVFPAVDFAVSLDALFNQLNNSDEQGAVVVAKVSQGCVESFIEATSEQNLTSEEIKAHPLMQFEIETQLELLSLLQNSNSRNKEIVEELRQIALSEGISNIGIERES